MPNQITNFTLARNEELRCSLCRYKFSQQKYLTSHCEHCKKIENPNDRLGCEPVTVKQEHEVGIEPTITINLEEMEIPEYTIYRIPLDLRTESPTHFNKSDYTAAKSTQLEEHLKVHTPDKGDVENVRKNSGEEPFKCTVCDHTFAYPSRLKEHLNTHTGENPFKCPICEDAFAQSSDLKCHIRKHTGEQPINGMNILPGTKTALLKHLACKLKKRKLQELDDS